MDERLTPFAPLEVLRRIASACLDLRPVEPVLGQIHLAPHQVDAVARLTRLIEAHHGAVLADSTGMGKTYVALAVARRLGPALIVAPASLRSMWRDAMRRSRVVIPFTSYEALSHGTSLPARPALVVLDEAHHARNPSSRRYGALADLAWGAGVLALTATPIHNRRRDLRAILALFLGSAAHECTEDEALRFVIRRTRSLNASGDMVPILNRPAWHAVPRDPRLLDAMLSLPEPVATADGSVAGALLVLGLVRAWCSSEAALRGALLRRLRRGAVLLAALECGRLPTRREAAAWPVVDSAVQLGFPGWLDGGPGVDGDGLRRHFEVHLDGVRQLLRLLDEQPGAVDDRRAVLLAAIHDRRPGVPLVAFTQFTDTANALFNRLAGRGGVAMVSGRGGRIASGRTSAGELLSGFDIDRIAAPRAMPLELLIATDVASEGIGLRRAGQLVHLDLPWTIARLEQRVGRLRRPGSPHARIDVHAIGPPVRTRELLTVVRTLQRKARLITGIAGQAERQAATPLLGVRLSMATKAAARRTDTRTREELREHLVAWSEGRLPLGKDTPGVSGTGVAMVPWDGTVRLVAIRAGEASDATPDVLEAVRVISACRCWCDLDRTGTGRAPPDAGPAEAAIRDWLSRQRARRLVRAVSDTPSPVHAVLLRQLNALVAAAPRADRALVAERVARCRRLAMAARAIGAERALAGLASAPTLDLQALEQMLLTRHRAGHGDEPGSPGAWLLLVDADGENVAIVDLPGLEDESGRMFQPGSHEGTRHALDVR